ncbi:MAG: arylsulfatase, partial [Luteolibacter sp.]
KPGSGGFSQSPKFKLGDPPGQLYNLRDDPSEKINLYEKNPELVAQLSHLMKQIVESPITRPN